MDRVAKQKRKRKEGSRGKRKRGQRQQLREPLCTCARVCLSSCLVAPAASSVRQCRLCPSLCWLLFTLLFCLPSIAAELQECSLKIGDHRRSQQQLALYSSSSSSPAAQLEAFHSRHRERRQLVPVDSLSCPLIISSLSTTLTEDDELEEC